MPKNVLPMKDIPVVYETKLFVFCSFSKTRFEEHLISILNVSRHIWQNRILQPFDCVFLALTHIAIGQNIITFKMHRPKNTQRQSFTSFTLELWSKKKETKLQNLVTWNIEIYYSSGSIKQYVQWFDRLYDGENSFSCQHNINYLTSSNFVSLCTFNQKLRVFLTSTT